MTNRIDDTLFGAKYRENIQGTVVDILICIMHCIGDNFSDLGNYCGRLRYVLSFGK